MRRNRLSGLVQAVVYGLLVMVAMGPGRTVEAQVKALITAPVDESKLVALKGSVPPQIHTAKDLGEADRSQPAGRLLLVLKRSDEQDDGCGCGTAYGVAAGAWADGGEGCGRQGRD